MLAIVNTQALIFPATAYSGEDVSSNEKNQESIMEIVVVKSVENR